MLCYAESEKDVGVFINTALHFSEHCEKVLDKANQQYGLINRTRHFV